MKKNRGIYKREGSPFWYIRYAVRGQIRRECTGTDDFKLAARILAKKKGEVAVNKHFEEDQADKHTVKEMLDRYLETHAKVNSCEKSYIRSRSIIANILTLIPAATLLSKVTTDMVARYRDTRLDQVSARSVQYEMQVLSHAFKLARKEWGWVKQNPVEDVARPSVKNFKEVWLSEEKEQELLGVLPAWIIPAVVFAIHTGLREDELLTLTWDNVKLPAKQFVLIDQKNGDTSTLPLDETAYGVLVDLAKVRSIACNNVFVWNGKPVAASLLYHTFKRGAKKVGLPGLRVHDLRHTFASRLVQRGQDISVVQKLGRWRDISMVKRYAHHSIDSMRKAVKVLDQAAAN